MILIFILLVTAMKKVEDIKTRRQAQFIYDRQKKARAIERKKDAKEVQRDLALIKSPAAGLKRPAKDMEIEDDDEEEEEGFFPSPKESDQESETHLGLDTSINLKDKGGKTKNRTKKKTRIIEEVESDQEMPTEAN